jgi:hypothetical protein
MPDRPSLLVRVSTSPRRCVYLFLTLVLLIVLLPAFDNSKEGQQWFSIISLLVLVASLIALGRSRFTVLVALLLVAPALLLLSLSEATGDAGYRVWSWRFAVAVLLVTLVPLLRYVLGPEPITLDKLFGGVATYLLLGLLWCYLYALVEHFSPGSIEGLSGGMVHVADMVFLSYGALTTGGLADIVPKGKAVHALVILEELTGTLFMAVVVARLVASYWSGGANLGRKRDDPKKGTDLRTAAPG